MKPLRINTNFATTLAYKTEKQRERSRAWKIGNLSLDSRNQSVASWIHSRRNTFWLRKLYIHEQLEVK